MDSKIKDYLDKKEDDYKIRSIFKIVYFQIRKIIFFFVGLINILFLKSKNEIPYDEAVILGRGKSVLQYYKDKSHISDIKHIFVVNFRNNDVPEGYLEKLNDKIVHLFISVAEVIPPLKYLKSFKIGRVIFSRCEIMRRNMGNETGTRAGV